MFLEGRPPVNVGVTSNGDVFGGSQISFGDVTGDQQFNVFIASISQYRTMAASYVNLSRPLPVRAARATRRRRSSTGRPTARYYDPAYRGVHRPRHRAGDSNGPRRHRARDLSDQIATAASSSRAASSSSASEYNDPGAAESSRTQYQQETYGRTLFSNGSMIPLGVEFVQETTVFREFGPLAGNTVRLAYDVVARHRRACCRARPSTPICGTTCGSAPTACWRRASKGSRASATYPDFTYFGGNSELRGYDYLQFSGQNAVFANAELRFPLIEAALTPIGVIGGIRGVFFANIGGAWFDGQPSPNRCSRSKRLQVLDERGRNLHGRSSASETDAAGFPSRTRPASPSSDSGPATAVSGFRLKDGRASYGVGLETFALGFPVHFDWSWRTLFNKEWEDVLFAAERRQRGVPEAALHVLDRLRLLRPGLGLRALDAGLEPHEPRA